jgi:hypothetical protein
MLSRPRITAKKDLIEILVEAEKQVEEAGRGRPARVRAFEGVRSLTVQEKAELAKRGIDPDYSQACTVTGVCACYGALIRCDIDSECLKEDWGATCVSGCPNPKPNSSQVSAACVVGTTNNCDCGALNKCVAGKTCTCTVSGLCYYVCTLPYVWDEATQTCVLLPSVKAGLNLPKALEIILADEG